MRQAIGVLLIGVTLAGCSARTRPQAATVMPQVDIDALLRRGCYSCLEEAFAAADDRDPRRAFEAAALLALRAKELGLDHQPHIEQAKALAPAYADAALYLEILDLARVDPLAGERYVSDATALPTIRGTAPRLPSIQERAAAWRAQLATATASPLFRSYLAATVTCISPGPEARTILDEILTAAGDPPILRFRAATCDAERAADLEALLTEDPAFVDVHYQRGIYAGARQDSDEALRQFTAAQAAFPSSLAIAVSLARVRLDREEWPEALTGYDAVLERMAVHRDALLGRTVALSQLRRHDEARSTATRMIELGSWFLGEAHYWRGWNEYMLSQLPAARADVDRAKTLMVNAAVYVLSGLIEWGENRLPTAEEEFQQALMMDFGRCDAARYLGRVRVGLGKIPEALAAFKQGVQCYELATTLRRKLIDDIRASNVSDATKARQIASHDRAIAELAVGRDECAKNAEILTARR